MSQLLSQLGIDWRLLIAQAVNFFLLLVILRLFVYKPLIGMMHERRKKIEEGIAKAEEADERLKEVNHIGIEKIKEAEATAMGILKKTELDAKALEASLLAKAKERESAAMASAEERIRGRETDADRAMTAEAAMLIKSAVARLVELSPEKIDDALVARAVKEVSVSRAS